MKKASLVVLLLLWTSFTAISILPERASANTLYVGGGGPGNYTTIQAAVDNASSGDIVYVYSGTYVESIDINKTISLIGEDKETTTIDAFGLGDVIFADASWVNISGFTVANSRWGYPESGVRLRNANNSLIHNNTLLNNSYGIRLVYSNNTTIGDNLILGEYGILGIDVSYSSGNLIARNSISNYSDGIGALLSGNNTIVQNNLSTIWDTGIYLRLSDREVVDSNTIDDGECGISIGGSTNAMVTDNAIVNAGLYISGSAIGHWNTHTIETSNTANGRPIYYRKNVVGGSIPPNAGQVVLANSSGVFVGGQTIDNATVGIELGFSYNNTLDTNNLTDNSPGILLYSSNNNSVLHNTVISDKYSHGIVVESSGGNVINANTLNRNSAGIDLDGTWENNVTYNQLMENVVGINSQSSSSDVLHHNDIRNNVIGIRLSSSDDYVIVGNNISGSVDGFQLLGSEGNLVKNNTVFSSNSTGFLISMSDHNTIENNRIWNSSEGIYLTSSLGERLSGNTFMGNGIALFGGLLEEWNTHIIDSSNTVNGRPIRYLRNATGDVVPNDSGQVILANCTGVLVEGQRISNASMGILLGYSSANSIRENELTNNSFVGLYMEWSSGNVVTNNTLSKNGFGMYIQHSQDNEFYHNFFLENMNQVTTDGSNQWDNGYPSGGNYWSDYSGVDEKSGLGQDEPGSDGIGDKPYNVSHVNQDRYPLISPAVPPPPNQPPTCAITYPISGARVSDIVIIEGTANDTDGTIQKVEIRIEDGPWIEVNGTASWSYDWNTRDLPEGPYAIYVRSYDGMNYSEVAYVDVYIEFVHVDVVQTFLGLPLWIWVVIILVIITIVVLLLVILLIWRRKRKSLEEQDEQL